MLTKVKGSVWDSADNGLAVSVEDFGATGDGTGTGDHAGILAAITYAATRTQTHAFTGGTAVARPIVVLRDGAEYVISEELTLTTTGALVDLYCEGKCILRSATSRTHKGIVFTQMGGFRAEGIIFSDFTTAIEGDTNNLNQATMSYHRCEWFGNDLGVDTVSYALSRSTLFSMVDCRARANNEIAKIYCDEIVIDRCWYQNHTDITNACLTVDGLTVIRDSVFVPTTVGATARWIDFYASDDARQLNLHNNRFSGEGGGINVVWNYADGTTTTNRVGISLVGGASYSNANTLTDESTIVLKADGLGTVHAPNYISIQGTWAASDTVIATESGLLPTLSTDNFVIDIGKPYQLTSAGGAIDMIPDILRPYFQGEWLFNKEVVSIATGTTTLDARKTKYFDMASGSALTITDVINGRAGDEVFIIAATNNITVQDISIGGTINLAGGANYVMTINDVLHLVYVERVDKWFEVSRSDN